MTLGGEHSITPGCIVPFTKKYKKHEEFFIEKTRFNLFDLIIGDMVFW